MSSTLSATHLLRVYALFSVVALLLLTIVRATYLIWQLHEFDDLSALTPVLLSGLRFDLALIALVLMPLIVLAGVLSMIGPARALTRWIIVIWLMTGLALILIAEYITPWFMANENVRPDLPTLGALSDPAAVFVALFEQYMVPMLVGLLVIALVLVAFAARLEIQRLLRYRVSVMSGLALMVFGLGLCALALASNLEFQHVLHPNDALISENSLINEIALNTGYKLAWSAFTGGS